VNALERGRGEDTGNSLPGSSQRKNVHQAASGNVRMAQVVVIGWPSSDIISARSPLKRSSESTSTPSQSKIMRSMVNRLPDGPLRSSAAKTSQRGYHSFNERTAQWLPQETDHE
jgi:hypothetical protein